jgi:hypothetical protein
MLLLAGTTEKVQVITSAAGDVDCHASFMDVTAGSDPVPDTQYAVGIVTATTTDVVAAPTGSAIRNVKQLLVRNVHASVTNTVTVRLTDGTNNADIFSVALAAGEAIQYLDGVGFQVLTPAGAVKTSQNQGANATGGAQSSAVLAADVTNNNATANTMQDVTGLSFPVTAGKKYKFQFCIQFTAAATTTGSRWSINGPGGTMRYSSWYSLTATSETTNQGLNAHDLPAAANASSAATGANFATVEGFYEASSTGTVIARFASEISASAIVAKAGSVVYFQEVQ